MADVREANVNVVGNWQMPVLGDSNESAISLEEVREAVNEIKSDKALGLDGFEVECLKKGSMAVLECLVVVVVVVLVVIVVPMDWRGACIVPLYKLERKTTINVPSQEVFNL